MRRRRGAGVSPVWFGKLHELQNRKCEEDLGLSGYLPLRSCGNSLLRPVQIPHKICENIAPPPVAVFVRDAIPPFVAGVRCRDDWHRTCIGKLEIVVGEDGQENDRRRLERLAVNSECLVGEFDVLWLDGSTVVSKLKRASRKIVQAI